MRRLLCTSSATRNSGQWLRQLQQQYSGKLIPGHRISLDLLNRCVAVSVAVPQASGEARDLDASLFNYLFLF